MKTNNNHEIIHRNAPEIIAKAIDWLIDAINILPTEILTPNTITHRMAYKNRRRSHFQKWYPAAFIRV